MTPPPPSHAAQPAGASDRLTIRSIGFWRWPTETVSIGCIAAAWKPGADLHDIASRGLEPPVRPTLILLRAHMTTRNSKAVAAEPPQRVITVKDPALEEGKLKALGGSRSDDFNNVLVYEVVQTLWTKHSGEALKDQQYAAVGLAASWGSAPRTSLKACSRRKP